MQAQMNSETATAMVADYKANPRQSYDDLTTRYGVTKSTVFVALRDGGAIVRSNREPRCRD
jgi:hypothetical protein